MEGQENTELNKEGQNALLMLSLIEKDPTILETDPKMKEFYTKYKEVEEQTKQGQPVSIAQEPQQTPLTNKDLLGFIKDNFGIEDPDKFVEEVNTWKQGHALAEQFSSEIQEMPEPLRNALDLYRKNDPNWSKVQLSGALDFSKEYSDKELVKSYFPGKFTDDELSDIRNSEDKTVRRAVDMAQESFKRDKMRAIEAEESTKRKIKSRNELVVQSLDKSIDAFKKQFPKATQAQIDRLKESAMKGSFQNMFFSPQGGFSESAVSNLYQLMYPNEYVGSKTGKVLDQQNKQAMEMLNRGTTPKQFNRTQAAEKSKDEIAADMVISQFSTKGDPFATRGKIQPK